MGEGDQCNFIMLNGEAGGCPTGSVGLQLHGEVRGEDRHVTHCQAVKVKPGIRCVHKVHKNRWMMGRMRGLRDWTQIFGQRRSQRMREIKKETGQEDREPRSKWTAVSAATEKCRGAWVGQCKSAGQTGCTWSSKIPC